MAYPQLADYAETTCSQLHVPVAAPSTEEGVLPDPDAQPVFRPPTIPPDHFRVAVGDRPSAALQGDAVPAHPIGPRDARVLVYNMKRPGMTAQEVDALLAQCEAESYTHPLEPLPKSYDPTICQTDPVDGIPFQDAPSWPTDPADVRAAIGRRLRELQEHHPTVYRTVRSVLGTMNGAIADCSPLASALLAVNVCSYALGATENARSVMFYLCKYMTKVHSRAHSPTTECQDTICLHVTNLTLRVW